MNKYLVIKENELKKHKQYMWFSTFSNPCYGFDVKMDVTKLVEYTKETKRVSLLILYTWLLKG